VEPSAGPIPVKPSREGSQRSVSVLHYIIFFPSIPPPYPTPQETKTKKKFDKKCGHSVFFEMPLKQEQKRNFFCFVVKSCPKYIRKIGSDLYMCVKEYVTLTP
jgi:hypothetical protein